MTGGNIGVSDFRALFDDVRLLGLLHADSPRSIGNDALSLSCTTWAGGRLSIGADSKALAPTLPVMICGGHVSDGERIVQR